MVSYKTLVCVSLALSVSLAVISFLAGDWMWFCVNILSAALLVLPFRKSLGYYYDQKVVWLTMIAPALLTALFLLDLALPIRETYVLDVSVYTYLTAMIQTVQTYVTGLMFALILNRSGMIRMTLTWVAVFALVFAMSMSALDLLFTFWDMYTDGYPVFNKDFSGGEVIVPNRILISSPFVATFLTLFMTLAIIAAGHGKDASDYIVEGEGAKARAEADVTDENAVADVDNGVWRFFADIFAVACGIALLLGAFSSESGHVSSTAIVCCAVCLIPPVIGRLKLIRLPPALILFICLSAVFHGYGLLAEKYGFSGSYDTLTHTMSSMTIGILVFYTLMCFQVYSKGKLGFTGNGLALFTALITLTFSTYWEVMEFMTDLFTGSNTQFSPYDTLTDLVCDMVGMAIASFAVDIVLRKRSVSALVASFRLDDRLKRFLAKDE